MLFIKSSHLCARASGLCGKPRITDVGGVPYLVPLVQKHKVVFSSQKIIWNNDQ